VKRPLLLPALVLAAIVGLAAAWHAVFVARTAFVLDGRTTFTLLDDAMISMRYARNLADGAGLRWNPGETPVEGTSNFLWTLAMAVPHVLGVPEHLTSLVVSVLGSLLLLTRVAVIWRTARVLAPTSGAAPLCAALLAAFSYATSFWTLRGMEVGLLSLLVDAAVLLVVSPGTWESVSRRCALAALVAAGVLTRTDAVVPLGVLAAWAVLTAPRERRGTVVAWLGAAIVVPLAAHTAFRVAYYGDPLPNTYYLKMTGAPAGERVARGGAALAALVSGSLGALVLAAAAGAVVVARRAVSAEPGARGGFLRSPAALLAGIVASTWAYSVWVGGDAWEKFGFANRYVAIGLGALQVLAGAAAARCGDVVAERVSLPRFAFVVRTCAGVGFAAAAAFILLRPSTAGATVLGLWSARRFAGGAALALVALELLRRAWRDRPGRADDVPDVRADADTSTAWDPRRVLTGLVVAALVWTATDRSAFRRWNLRNAEEANAHAMMARLGHVVREGTDEGARVAFVWAGTAPYFAHRTAVDLLGKSDPVIARMRPVAPFFPGHDKWDLRRSLGDLRPDVAVELWNPTDEDLALVRSWGYRELPNGIRVLTGSPHVRADVLGRPWREATFRFAGR